MGSELRTQVAEFIENYIDEFHSRRLQLLIGLRLRQVLLRKNPYLFRAKNEVTAQDLVKTILDAHLSSQEEGIFGDFLESLAIFVCRQVHGGRKSSAPGIDMEFEHQGTHYLVTIKSGPNWGNSRQISKMVDDFRKAKRTLRTSCTAGKVVAVNGCCYGKDDRPNKGDYWKLCGQKFWEFISNDPELYTEIIEPLGSRAKERNERFHEEYAKVVTKFTREFSQEYCSSDGAILWEKLVWFNSGKGTDRTVANRCSWVTDSLSASAFSGKYTSCLPDPTRLIS